MGFIFRGSGSESFILSAPSAAHIGLNSSPYIDTTYCYEGNIIYNGSSNYTGVFSSSQTEVWAHCSLWLSTTDTNESILQLYDSGTNAASIDFQLVNGASNPQTAKLGRWNGASFTYSSNFNLSTINTLNDIDLHVKIAVSGSINLYVNGINVYSFSGDTSAVGTSFSKIFFPSGTGAAYSGTATNNYFSQVIVGDSSSDTRGLKLVSLEATGSGTTSQWTGAYTTFTKIGINDTTFCLDSTPNDISTFAVNTRIPSSWVPIEVSVSSRALLGTANTTNMQHVIRSGGTNYPGSNVIGNQSTFQPTSQTIWAADPNGSIPWTRTSANAIEFGFKSIA